MRGLALGSRGSWRLILPSFPTLPIRMPWGRIPPSSLGWNLHCTKLRGSTDDTDTIPTAPMPPTASSDSLGPLLILRSSRHASARSLSPLMNSSVQCRQKFATAPRESFTSTQLTVSHCVRCREIVGAARTSRRHATTASR